MVSAKARLPDGQGALVRAAGAVYVALVGQDAGKVVEGQGGVGAVGAMAGLADGQSALEQPASVATRLPANH